MVAGKRALTRLGVKVRMRSGAVTVWYVLCLIADITFSSDVTLEKLLGFTGSIGLGGGSGWSSVLAVRTGRLRRSLAVHSRPIDLVVFQEPSHESCWKPRLGGGFALRCLQRLSGPDLATRRCP